MARGWLNSQAGFAQTRGAAAAKLPAPVHAHLVGLRPEIRVYPPGTTLTRIYFAGGRYPVAWNEFRYWGPVPSARFDPHLPTPAGKPGFSHRGVMYLGKEGITCLAEVFQLNRVIDRVWNTPYMVVFTLKDDLKLLDLTGAFATRMGASYAIHSGPRDRCRVWSRALYDAYPDINGLLYRSSMQGGEAVALFERGMDVIPPRPDFNRPLADQSLTDAIDRCVADLGYLKA